MRDNEIVTADLSRFGYRELALAGELLKAYGDNGAPRDFDEQGVSLTFNTNSGNVFLTNENADVCMMTSDKTLESWYYLGYEGHEGFLDDLLDYYRLGGIKHPDDIQQLRDIAKTNGKRLPRRKKF